jgi:hypothetical protein
MPEHCAIGQPAADSEPSPGIGFSSAFPGDEAALSPPGGGGTLPPRSQARHIPVRRIPPMFLRFGQRLVLLAAVLLPVVAGGCSTLLTVAYLVAPEDTPAEFKGLRGKHVVVVCKPIVELEYSDAGTSRELANTVTALLRENVRKTKLIEQHEVAKWTDENTWVDYPAVGKALDADLVVGIDLEEFRMHEGSTLYRGKATAHVRVFDVAEKKVVFEKRFDDFAFPSDSAIPTSDRTETQFRAMFLQILGKRIARCFHSSDSRTIFAEDSLTF